MSDISPAVAEFLHRRYRSLSGSARARMALEMFETAQRIVLSSLPAGLGETERRRELCRRFYGDELARRIFGGHER